MEKITFIYVFYGSNDCKMMTIFMGQPITY